MLLSIKQLHGDKLGAFDGDIGHVKDFYFDDRNWVVRYLVADTGSWLPGRKVLLSPHAIGQLRPCGKILPVKLTRTQIENSPLIETHKPVSRQYEEEYYQYYGWPYYWQGDGLWGMNGFPLMDPTAISLPVEEAAARAAHADTAEAHLRSAQAVNGYHVKTTDGASGHVCDFLLDDESWAICELVVKTGHRFTGKEVRIPAASVDRISYEDSTVYVSLTADAVEQSPEHHLAAAVEVACGPTQTSLFL